MFQSLMAVPTSSRPIWCAASLLGSTCTRTAYLADPNTCTCATPETIETRCATIVSAYSSRSESRIVDEVTKKLRIGVSPGFTLRNEGGLGIPGGSSGMASAIAVSTSTVAPSISRSRLNCKVMLVDPWLLDEIIESSPAIVVNCRSSGVATADAMVSGFAPGRPAETVIVG